jgi:hypothetical protein
MSPLDQAPAADPAHDALDRVALNFPGLFGASAASRDFATIRAALADRTTPAEASIILNWQLRAGDGYVMDGESALIARLGKIAEAGR